MPIIPGPSTRSARMRPLAAALAALCITTLGAGEPVLAANASGGLLAGMAVPLPHTRLRMPASDETGPPRAPRVVPVTNCDDSGAGSLRDSITGAVTGDTIDLTQLNCSTISLTTGAIIFGQDDLEIAGPGRNRLTIDAGASPERNGALVHLGFGTLIVRDLTLANGEKYTSDSAALGGCIHSGGSAIVVGSLVTGCLAHGTNGQAALGGAVWSQEITYLSQSEVSSNRAVADYHYASGGGVYALGGIMMGFSLVSGNSASSPSAVPSFGGGVFARGTASIVESCIANNSSSRMGGAALADNGNLFNAVIRQSTISQNFADQVGGVYSRRPLFLYNSTIANNFSISSIDGSGTQVAAGLQMGPELLTFHSNILADNFVLDATPPFDLGGKPGVNTTGTFNLITGTPLSPPPDTIGFTPALGPLQDNGGLTPTHALIRGLSYAIDSGGPPPGGALPNDQRGTGFPRTIGTIIDIGAYESDPDRIFTNGFNFGMTQQPAAVPGQLAAQVGNR